MALSCGTKVLKYFVFASNAVVCMLGFLFLVLSISALAATRIPPEIPVEQSDIDPRMERAGLVMIAVFSGFVFLTGFLGCFGALSENRGMLLMYSVMNLAFIVLIISAQFVAVAGRKRFEEKLQLALNEIYNTSEARQNFTEVENAFHCCGATADLKEIFIKEELCKGDLRNQPDCCSVIVRDIGVGYLVLTFFLLVAVVFSMAASCILRSSLVDRSAYSEF